VCDDNVNIYQACRFIYPKTVVQLCLTHYKHNLRRNLDVKNNEYYAQFMIEITDLFKKKRSPIEFNGRAIKIWNKYKDNDVAKNVLTEIQKRTDVLCSHWINHDMPQTTNLIESYNSHLQGRLETIKGFESFEHADLWLNAYFLRRRTKAFTDCTGKFKNLNGTTSLEQSSTKTRIYSGF
jgi:transposase-like protein